jgi:hypothetical protein
LDACDGVDYLEDDCWDDEQADDDEEFH